MLAHILLVPVIMAAATGGTIGMIKVIQKIAPHKVDGDGNFKEGYFQRKIRENQTR